MYAMEYYKAIKQPEPNFIQGSKVSIRTRYNHIVHGTIISIARVYMRVQYENNSSSIRPNIENFHMQSLYGQNSTDRIIVPEIEEYNRMLSEAKAKLANQEVSLSSFKLNDPQLVFYLVDAIEDFYAPTPIKDES